MGHPSNRLRRARFAWGLLLFAISAGGCTPERDWRDLALPGTPLVAELPCRPERFQREVGVAGERLQLFMLSCEAAGVTYGVADAEVGDARKMEPVLAGLADAARHGLAQAQGDFIGRDLPGSTPFRGNVSARLRGLRPDGVAVEESVWIFGRGTRVYEASAIGPRLPDDALAPFEDGLHFALESGTDIPR